VKVTVIAAPVEKCLLDLLAIVKSTAIAESVASVNAHAMTTGTTAPSRLKSS
jgi:hypothetical protein